MMANHNRSNHRLFYFTLNHVTLGTFKKKIIKNKSYHVQREDLVVITASLFPSFGWNNERKKIYHEPVWCYVEWRGTCVVLLNCDRKE